MAKQYVNLDALLPREDFQVTEDSDHRSAPLQTLSITELEKGKFTFSALRKPDFQRETSNWSPQHVVDFIRSFIEGDLIPSVILWQSPTSSNLFVIDGAHRLSALIAWVHDDYGDRGISRDFYENRIQPEQEHAAEHTRELVKDQIGTYLDFKKAIQYPDNSSTEIVRKAKRLAVTALPLQWVPGDAGKAEDSFFRINQKPASIDQTELQIIKCRQKPNAIAARALIRSGVGHRFWKGFTEDNQLETERIAKEVHQMLFHPPMDSPIKTLDLPVAGKGYSPSSLRLIFEFVNLVNETRTKSQMNKLLDDNDGQMTVDFLKKVKRYAGIISSNESRSLGLHPAVYFYGVTGNYLPAAFLAVVEFVMKLEQANLMNKFTSVRSAIEDYLVHHRHFVSQIISQKGSGFRAVPSIVQMYTQLFEGKLENVADAEMLQLLNENGLPMLSEDNDSEAGKGEFSKAAKNAAYLRDALKSAVRCGICGSRLHRKSISIDHIDRRESGGESHSDNAQLAHPYCNSGYKESGNG